jgi:hypothetical protein
MTLGRASKKAKMSFVLSDEEEEDESSRSFSQSLSRFKKSPIKRGASHTSNHTKTVAD